MTWLIFGLTRRRVISLLMGLAMIAGGSWLVRAALFLVPLDPRLVFAGLAVAVLGGLLVLPSELAAAFRILVEVATPMLGAVRGAFTGAPPRVPDLAVQDLPRAKAYAANREED